MRSEDPYCRVGVIGLDAKGKVVGTGYNGLKSGYQLDWSDRESRLKWVIHAEDNLFANNRHSEIETIACTLLPCEKCAKNIVAHNVKEVIYGEIYHRDQSALEIFKIYGIKCTKVSIEEAKKAIHSIV